MDWNWYFSTLSQSAAGIVGIIGAFIITKILNNQSIFKQKSTRTKQLLAESKLKIAEAEHLKIDWYCFQTARRLKDKFDKQFHKNNNLRTSEFYEAHTFPAYMDRVKAIELIDTWLGEAIAETASENNLHDFGKFSIESDSTRTFRNEHRRDVDAHGDVIDKCFIDCRYQTEINKNHFAEIQGNPEASREIDNTINLLSLLFFLGVIYPISFLPVSTAGFEFTFLAIIYFYFSLKGLLLSTVTILFFLIVRNFKQLNESLKHDNSEVVVLNRLSLLGEYSEAFVTRETNLNRH